VVALMQHPDNNRGLCDNEVNCVGKPLKKCSPDIAPDLRKLQRILCDAFQKSVKP
jgi:hypothetical protein